MGTPLATAFRVYDALQQIGAPLGRLFRRRQHRPQVRIGAIAPGAGIGTITVQSAAATRARPPRRLRVVRVWEGPQATASAGRMVISGRMADVCAELERLAALEAAAG